MSFILAFGDKGWRDMYAAFHLCTGIALLSTAGDHGHHSPFTLSYGTDFRLTG